MNKHITLYSPAAAFATASPSFCETSFLRRPDCLSRNAVRAMASKLHFKTVTHADMPEIWHILTKEPGRTTDFSYGGLLMWVDYFQYEYAIVNDTLFIRGRVESDLSKSAFSLPVGKMSLDYSVAVLSEYCRVNKIPLIFSAVPEYALEDFQKLNPESIEPILDWSDYLYDAASLATLTGKKYGKKRNHVNQFLSSYPDFKFEIISPENADDAIAFMDRVDAEGDQTPMAITERSLNRRILELMRAGDPCLKGAIIRDGGDNVLAFTVGDVKGDTLFIHIEKSLREVPGGFEMINKSFADYMTANNSGIRFINREDDSGDPGLRYAKQSYHPIDLLKKYNITFSL